MISYYFEGNSEYVSKAFEKAQISLANKGFREFVEEVEEYLTYEYNTPFKDFLEKASCRDILDAYNKEEAAQEFVDAKMLSSESLNSNISAVLFAHKQKI